MNRQECDILRTLNQDRFSTQRSLAEVSGYSLGAVNKSLKSLKEEGIITENSVLTEKAYRIIRENSPRNAIILAAGFGMRMVPINTEVPKAFLEINGEPLIERIIKQLKDVGINDITIVVGYMKERFEYLIDDFGVDLIVNPDYSGKNNLHSLRLASERISNTYIVPCDIWCNTNPFSASELYSWYMVSDKTDKDSDIRVNRKGELVTVGSNGNTMIGIAYVLEEDAAFLKANLKSYDQDPKFDDQFWERALYIGDKMSIPARSVRSEDYIEINTYEQLRDLDGDSNQLKSDALDIISNVFGIPQNDITDISVLKKGMTNRSFLFTVRDSKYIMRIPGEGTDKLINRKEEAEVFKAISGLGLCDDPVYINPENGYKITRFLDGVRVADPECEADLIKCMDRLRSFHEMRLSVDHTFDIFGQIDFYESLWPQKNSIYRDYEETKANVLKLRPYIDSHIDSWVLTHIDAVPDNFLFYKDGNKEMLQLTDWEYSGMQDPHVDIAMFCIYSLYNKTETDKLIDLYFEGKCDHATRIKIYCYVAACGLLWSNWCEYKRSLGIEFGEYSLRQYRYAKDYYKYAIAEI